MIITHNDLDGVVSAYFVMKGAGQLGYGCEDV